MGVKRVIPHDSKEERDITTSILYGLIHGVFLMSEDIIASQFNYHGAEIEQGTDAQKANNQHFTGLKIKMASGTYRVKIEREA